MKKSDETRPGCDRCGPSRRPSNAFGLEMLMVDAENSAQRPQAGAKVNKDREGPPCLAGDWGRSNG